MFCDIKDHTRHLMHAEQTFYQQATVNYRNPCFTQCQHVALTFISFRSCAGIIVNKPRDGMSWPVVVAALLFFCTILFVLGVRKWCQYQKEM